MADLNEAFNTIQFETKNFNSIDYFFTQRNLKEEHEFLDQNMNRKNKQVNIQYNFLALNIPQNQLNDGISATIEINIFGDYGYHYKGKIFSYKGCMPNFMIPLKGDKKIFVHLIYNQSDKERNDTDKEGTKMTYNTCNKEFVCFIEVPKRYQTIDTIIPKLKNESETSVDALNI